MKILDAGCGIGGSAIWLAQNIGCSVTGITLVPHQVKQARRLASKYQLSDLTHFEIQDFTQTNFPANTFDIVWATESTGHAPDKLKFITEAYRILKPQGRLVVADYYRTKKHLTPKQTTLMDQFLTGWILTNLPSINQYQNWLTNVGFIRIQTRNITRNILPFSKWLARTCKLLLPLAYIGKFLHALNQTEINNAKASIAQYPALTQNLWQYYLVLAQKP